MATAVPTPRTFTQADNDQLYNPRFNQDTAPSAATNTCRANDWFMIGAIKCEPNQTIQFGFGNRSENGVDTSGMIQIVPPGGSQSVVNASQVQFYYQLRAVDSSGNMIVPIQTGALYDVTTGEPSINNRLPKLDPAVAQYGHLEIWINIRTKGVPGQAAGNGQVILRTSAQTVPFSTYGGVGLPSAYAFTISGTQVNWV